MKKRASRASPKKNRGIYLLIATLLAVIFLRSFLTSLFVSRQDRINIVFWGQDTRFISLDRTGGINYIIHFYPDLKILVPGGFGYYRIGALGKLISLEKDSQLWQRTFSSATSTLVGFYFYPATTQIYFGKEIPKFSYQPDLKEILFSKTNANLFDRIYLLFALWSAKKTDFQVIEAPVTPKKGSGEFFFDENRLKQSYLGFFYQKTYRRERQTVQILYTKSYKSAELISRILESNGIRVVDISKSQNGSKPCNIFEQTSSFSQTASDLGHFFRCPLQQGKTGVSDIILELGDQEAQWAIE